MNPTPNSIRRSAAMACGLSLAASAWAAELSLSTPKPTKAGNLAFEARGTPNSQAVLEVSANLVEWVPMELLTLTNSALPLYLRPTGDLHFCRLRIPNANELPNPISFHPIPNTDFILSTFSLDEPFSLKMTDDDGYTYALSVPESALADPDTCQLQVVNQANGLPAGLSYLTGAMISPSDLPVLGDVMLNLTVPAGTDLTKVTAIQWSRDGAELHFVPLSIANSTVQIRIHRFGGVGLVRLNGGDLHSILQTVPTHPIAQIEHQIALSAEPFKSLAFAANRDRATTHTPTDCAQSTLALNLLRRSRAELRMAIYNDFFLETALNWYNALSGFGDASNEPCFAEVQALIDECDGLAAEALLASVEREVRRCRSERNLQAVLRLYRDIRLAHTGRWSRRFTQDQIEHLREVFHECLHFKVELLSTTSVQAKSGTVRTSMSSVFEVQNEPYVDPVSGNTVLRIHGNGDWQRIQRT